MSTARILVAATVMASLCSAPASAQVPVHGGNVVEFAGDSITAFGWPTVAGGLADQLQAQVTSYQATITCRTVLGAALASSTGHALATTGTSTVPKIPLQFVNTGVPGITSDDILANMPGYILNANPDVLVLEIGTNEHQGTGGWPLSRSETNLRAIIDQTRAARPGIPIAIVGLMTYSEQWDVGPPLAWSPPDPDTDAHCAMQQSVSAAYPGVKFFDLRNPMLIYESLHNLPGPPGAVSGFLTGDGRHPTTTGQQWMGNTMINGFTVLSP